MRAREGSQLGERAQKARTECADDSARAYLRHLVNASIEPDHLLCRALDVRRLVHLKHNRPRTFLRVGGQANREEREAEDQHGSVEGEVDPHIEVDFTFAEDGEEGRC